MITPLPDEGDLLKRCSNGDTAAFGKLVSHYQDTIFNLVLRMIGNYEDAQDLTQEVFIKAFRSVGSFQRRSSLATWLYSIAVNQTISERRRKGTASRAGTLHVSLMAREEDGQAYDPPDGQPGPARQAAAAESRRQVEQAIAELGPDHRTVVVLRDVQGLDYKTIGRVLRCSRGTVKSRLHRARVELRRKLHHLVNERTAP